jgi:hypothetical protein
VTVIDWEARRRQRGARPLSDNNSPFTTPMHPLAEGVAEYNQAAEQAAILQARADAEELLSLATLLASIHRTYTTSAGLDRAEQIKRRMRLILGSAS